MSISASASVVTGEAPALLDSGRFLGVDDEHAAGIHREIAADEAHADHLGLPGRQITGGPRGTGARQTDIHEAELLLQWLRQ